jgi:hypothetical protein
MELFTVKEIAKECERVDYTIYYWIYKNKFKPKKRELVKGNAYINYYSKGQKTKILADIQEVEKSQSLIPPKRIPEIIYVTRTTEIYQSKLNFLELNQL